VHSKRHNRGELRVTFYLWPLDDLPVLPRLQLRPALDTYKGHFGHLHRGHETSCPWFRTILRT